MDTKGNESKLDTILPEKPFWTSVLHRVVTMQNANKRQGTHDTKTRGEVRGGGRKPFKQKGTGQARQGSIRSPLLVGGGTVFGPHPRKYTQKVNKKEYKLALRQAIALKKKENLLYIIDELKLPTFKTKDLINRLKEYKIKSALVIDEKNENLTIASKNIPNVKSYGEKFLNVLDIMKYEKLLITKQSVDNLVQRLS